MIHPCRRPYFPIASFNFAFSFWVSSRHPLKRESRIWYIPAGDPVIHLQVLILSSHFELLPGTDILANRKISPFFEWILRRGCVKTDLESSEEKNKNKVLRPAARNYRRFSMIDKVSKDFIKKVPKRFTDLEQFVFWPFLTSKWPQNSNLTWSTQHNLGVPKIFNFIKFSVWALLRP